MAEFQASLIDPITGGASAIIDGDCTQIQITDSSNYVQFKKITGTVAVTSGSVVVSGTGTLFTSELNPSDVVSIGGLQFIVNTITSDILMNVIAVYPNVSEIGLDILLQEQEGAHDQADFDSYIKIIVAHQGGDLFVFTNFIDPATSLLDGDEAIVTPSVNPNITVNYNVTQGDGVYHITLCSIPGYDDAETYDKGDGVFFNDLLYESLVNFNTGATPDANPSKWKQRTEDEMPAKYCTFRKVVLICDLAKCKNDLSKKAFCSVRDHICDDDVLCKNEEFLNFMKILVIDEAIDNMYNRGAFDEIEEAIRLSNTICKCC